MDKMPKQQQLHAKSAHRPASILIACASSLQTESGGSMELTSQPPQLELDPEQVHFQQIALLEQVVRQHCVERKGAVEGMTARSLVKKLLDHVYKVSCLPDLGPVCLISSQSVDMECKFVTHPPRLSTVS